MVRLKVWGEKPAVTEKRIIDCTNGDDRQTYGKSFLTGVIDVHMKSETSSCAKNEKTCKFDPACFLTSTNLTNYCVKRKKYCWKQTFPLCCWKCTEVRKTGCSQCHLTMFKDKRQKYP